MKSFGLKAITAISTIAILSGALTGCTSTPKHAQGVTDCQDLSNPKSWTDNWTYKTIGWNHGSKMYPGFGTFSCSEEVTLTMRFKPLGLNFVAGATYVSYGADQITIVNSPTPGAKWFSSDSVIEIPSGITKVAPDVTFQPVVEITQSRFGFTPDKEPVRAVITLKAKDKKAISFTRTIQFSTAKSFTVSDPNKDS